MKIPTGFFSAVSFLISCGVVADARCLDWTDRVGAAAGVLSVLSGSPDCVSRSGGVVCNRLPEKLQEGLLTSLKSVLFKRPRLTSLNGANPRL